MSGKFMKGFLIFAVVFFFVVVGLVGLTVVMKRHENAQIAEENKTLVAPDPQKIQRLVDRIDFNIDVNDQGKKNIAKNIAKFLNSCPRIVNISSNNTTIRVSDAYGFVDWDKTGASINVFIEFKKNNQRNLPARFSSEEGLAEYGLVGGGEPGALMIWPFSRWLCNAPSSHMTYHEMNKALDKKEVTYKDLIQFIPLKDIPPNSF